jgi:hypothetical protein
MPPHAPPVVPELSQLLTVLPLALRAALVTPATQLQKLYVLAGLIPTLDPLSACLALKESIPMSVPVLALIAKLATTAPRGWSLCARMESSPPSDPVNLKIVNYVLTLDSTVQGAGNSNANQEHSLLVMEVTVSCAHLVASVILKVVSLLNVHSVLSMTDYKKHVATAPVAHIKTWPAQHSAEFVSRGIILTLKLVNVSNAL